MKFFVMIFFFFRLSADAQTSAYDLSIESATGKKIMLNDFKGQKILIASVSQENLDKKNAFAFWDSLQKANPKVGVIIIPARDIGSDTSTSVNSSVAAVAPANIKLGSSSNVKKVKGQTQNPIMKWLTTAAQNNHFDGDVNSDTQIFMISQNGVLYAVLENGAPLSMIDAVLKQDESSIPTK